MLIPFTRGGYTFTVQAKKSVPEGYDFPSINDFWITGIASIFFAVISIVLKSVFHKLFLPYCKEQKDLKKREIRTNKAAGCLYKFIYFLWATSWGYYVLKD